MFHGLFNGLPHRLTSPYLWLISAFSIVKTCTGSQHPFKLSISTYVALSAPLQYGIRFFQHPLPPKPSPILTYWIPIKFRWGLLGLPSSLRLTFIKVFRDALSSDCTTDDKGTSKNNPYLTTYRFGLGGKPTLHRFIITEFIMRSLSFPMDLLASPTRPSVVRCCRYIVLISSHTPVTKDAWISSHTRSSRERLQMKHFIP